MAALRTAYTAPLSLWRLVEQHVQPYEQDELKDMLGCSLVEQSLELHAEIDMLLEIWREVKEENDESSRAQSALPEPPNQRDRLVQEICFFVDNVKDQAKRKGIDPEHIFKNHNSEILDYAADKAKLREERSLLEKELFATEKMSSTPAVYKPMFNTTNRVLPQTPPTPTGRSSPLSPSPIKTAVSRAALSNLSPMRANHQVFVSSSEICSANRNDVDRQDDGRLNLTTDPSQLADDLSLALENELFGLSESSSRSASSMQAQACADVGNVRDFSTAEQTDHHKHWPVRSQQAESQRKMVQDKTLRDISKSGSCLDDEKTPIHSVLPTPPRFPSAGLPKDPPLPSHSDSDLGHQPAPPSVRPGVGVSSGSGRMRRRTVSPRPRLRVVDVTDLVEAHAGKGDSEIPCHTAETVISFSTGSSAASSYTSPTSTEPASVSPSPPGALVEREHGVRPGSANRFREMVLGCRNGE
ncbi:coiled-coil domain-containing protein 24-like [Elysia marginata]|uniref:Coiled-coil domain-containing protein 24-like n=1 Tax=Elysia marginata TaxID=1093978 RepID=A0AAV4IXK8_9GAST|nr:coiled-coil domain-containing protein 24-like [Elysia marginata]